MAKNEIEKSQQESGGFVIGEQGNNDIGIPTGVKGSHEPKHHPVDLHIENQDRSSATNQEKSREESGQDGSGK